MLKVCDVDKVNLQFYSTLISCSVKLLGNFATATNPAMQHYSKLLAFVRNKKS